MTGHHEPSDEAMLDELFLKSAHSERMFSLYSSSSGMRHIFSPAFSSA